MEIIHRPTPHVSPSDRSRGNYVTSEALAALDKVRQEASRGQILPDDSSDVLRRLREQRAAELG